MVCKEHKQAVSVGKELDKVDLEALEDFGSSVPEINAVAVSPYEAGYSREATLSTIAVIECTGSIFLDRPRCRLPNASLS